jgi:hypothetical protein
MHLAFVPPDARLKASKQMRRAGRKRDPPSFFYGNGGTKLPKRLNSDSSMIL